LTKPHFYGKNLSQIHDSDFGFFAEGASQGILEILKKHNIHNGHIVDLGCGSGILAKNLTAYGYSITGVDLSPDMIALAKKNVPNAHFITSSFYSVDIPPSATVTATGECFNYLFDDFNSMSMIKALFRRIYNSLNQGGLFIFDFAMPGRVESSKKKNWNRDNWEMKVKHHEDNELNILTRNITLKFNNESGKNEEQETHHLRLFEKEEFKSLLLKTGFKPEFVNGYGSYSFPIEKGYGGFVAKKCE
jgi:SAM-dependent methyltransferase